MSVEIDFKVMLYGIVAVFLIILFASIYFGLTSPAGQQGLVGIFQQIGNALMSPITSFFNGIGTIIGDFFHAIGNAITHLF